MSKLIRFLLVAGIIAALLVSAGCGQGADTGQESTKVRLAEVTHSIFYAPQYVALTQGIFEKHGLDVELAAAFGGDKTMTALLSDSADVILMGSEATMYVANQDANDLAVNFAQLTQRDGSFLVSRQPIENFSWDMLKGKVLLGQRKGGMPEMVSEYVQYLNGLEPHKDVEIIQNVEFQNLGPAFASGTGDFVQLFEPVASAMEIAGKGYVIASMGKESGKLPYTVYITKESIIDDQPETIQKFTDAVYEAQQWVNSHSIAEIADAIQPHFSDTDRETMLMVLNRYKEQDTWATDPILDEEEYHNLEAVMEYAGELTNKVPYEKVVNTEFARKAMNK
ncbi:ABC transporter substrate-binding protein [Metallumcola ferriviriculae]|uniref:ABC transporter substrate-binding protein n=1 Tax=Metallumcola ferriviriculae TaxID=3039180 RepID=A0AAU0UN70_9FIRM|nr:ABC transporter substrate-binding protein [Desulfitibacteraceae bacterium MK1]